MRERERRGEKEELIKDLSRKSTESEVALVATQPNTKGLVTLLLQSDQMCINAHSLHSYCMYTHRCQTELYPDSSQSTSRGGLNPN